MDELFCNLEHRRDLIHNKANYYKPIQYYYTNLQTKEVGFNQLEFHWFLKSSKEHQISLQGGFGNIFFLG
jgi:hypothetical protein